MYRKWEKRDYPIPPAAVQERLTKVRELVKKSDNTFRSWNVLGFACKQKGVRTSWNEVKKLTDDELHNAVKEMCQDERDYQSSLAEGMDAMLITGDSG